MNIEDNLIDYLISNFKGKKYENLDLCRYNISYHLHGDGEQFKSSKKAYFSFDNQIRDLIEYFAIRLFHNRKVVKKRKILSSAYSSWNSHLSDLGYDVYSPTWNLRRNFKVNSSMKLYLLTKFIARSFIKRDFNYLISDDFNEKINNYYVLFKENVSLNNFSALVVPQDVSFFEKLAIKVFKELGKPTFFLAHGGMPLRYDGVMGNRTDYSIQWGKKQVDSFVKMGYDSSKFFISGHPSYNTKPKYLRFEFDKILVLTKSLTRVSPQDKAIIEDKGNAIMYLYSIQNVLENIGIKNVLLRPNPSENYGWYRKFIDNSFYKEDKSDISNSLKKATLVIGPTSTSIIDSLYQGVNYVIYEPTINNLTILGLPITPPLDGSDARIPIARSHQELKEILFKKRKI
ncbi:MAG: hypothetical protein HQ521_17465, partial [Bacteroidetes bacterium]|nr:hypothetical protein [Bacteroidota bacterium]